MTYKNDEIWSKKCIKEHINRLHGFRIIYPWGPDAVLAIAEELKKDIEHLIKMCNKTNNLRDLLS